MKKIYEIVIYQRFWSMSFFKLIFKSFLVLSFVFYLASCNHRDELKNEDYYIEMLNESGGQGYKIFFKNKSAKKQEDITLKIYVHILDSDDKYLIYENTFDEMNKDQIIWDTVDFSDEEFVKRMVVIDDETDMLKSNFEFVYEVYDKR
ncbi:MAG: hypothetical protein ACI4U3_06355 [Traorella sp.]